MVRSITVPALTRTVYTELHFAERRASVRSPTHIQRMFGSCMEQVFCGEFEGQFPGVILKVEG